MGRELKFRAWDTVLKEFKPLSGSVAWPSSNELVSAVFYDEPRFILMQYIGLKDSNGKRIFESDIVGKKTKGGINKQVIIWNNEGLGWDWETATDDDWPDEFSGFIDEYNVIGNIYENPELLTAPTDNKANEDKDE